MPARKDKAQGHSSTLDKDQAREMILSNAFGVKQWEGLQLNGFAQGHTYMDSFYEDGVLANQAVNQDPVTTQYRDLLVAKMGAERADAVLGMTRFNNIIYPNLIINAQYQSMRVIMPMSVDRTIVRIHSFRLKGAPDEIFHRAIRFQSTVASPASMIFSDDVVILERCQQGLDEQTGPWFDCSRGMANDRAEARNKTASNASEMPTRMQFKAWLSHMTEEAV
jgi:hypothetical protein